MHELGQMCGRACQVVRNIPLKQNKQKNPSTFLFALGNKDGQMRGSSLLADGHHDVTSTLTDGSICDLSRGFIGCMWKFIG